MAVNWNLGIRQTTPLDAFTAGMERGQERRRQEDTRNALAAYATNPSEQTLNPLAQYVPEFVMQERRGMADQQRAAMNDERAQLEKRLKIVGQAAQWADTPEKWDSAVDYLSQTYPDLAEYKGKFSPEARMAAISAAGEFDAYLERTKPVNVGPGSHLVDPITGQAKFSAPFAPRPVTVSEGETVVEYAPGGGSIDDIWRGMIRTESRGQQFGANGQPLTSPAGAIGIAQVMPGTAPEAARLAGLPFDEQRYRTDPAYNEALGRAYFEKQLADFGGDTAKAVAAYNAGPGRVQAAVRKGGENWQQHLPGETKGYLQSVLGPAGSRVIAQGPPKQAKPEWRTLSPQEAQQRGLPAGTVYQVSPQGEVKPIGGQPSQQQAAKVRQKLTDLAPIEAQVARVEAAMEKAEKDGWTGYVMGRVPGGLDAESDTFDKSVRMLATLVRKLTRTPGEGAMSDYESRLAEMTLPTRTDTPEGRREALAGIRELISNIRAGYEEMGGASVPAPQQAAPAQQRSGGQQSAPKRLRYNPATGRLE